jgi:hypothetical protein
MRKYFPRRRQTLQLLHSNFFIYEENLILFFYQCILEYVILSTGVHGTVQQGVSQLNIVYKNREKMQDPFKGTAA